MNLYRDLIIELSKNPLNRREIKNAPIAASGANVTCGDRVRLSASLEKSGTALADVAFQGEGCAISIAAASLLTEEARGKSSEEILAWGYKEMNEWLGVELGPARVKCGLLALETLQEGIRRHAKK